MLGGEESSTAAPQISENSSKRSPQSRESSQQPIDAQRVVPRASSPAKRSFHIMSQDIDHSQNDDMELDDAVNIVGVDSRAARPSPAPISPPDLQNNRTVRGPSVDMLKNVLVSGEREPDRPGMEEKDRPSYDEQLSYIMQVQNEELKNGAVGYVVSLAWLQRPWSRTSEKKDDGSIPKAAREGPVGPVDNTDIVPHDYDRDLRDENDMPFVPIKPTADIESHYIVLPADAWSKVTAWYGTKGGSPEIRRYIHDTAPDGSARPHYQYELRPPIFTICKLRHRSQTANDVSTANVPAPRVLASRNKRFQQFLAEAKKRAGIDVKTKVKVWRILETIPTTEQAVQTGILTPATSRSGSPAPANGTPAQDQKLEVDSTTFSNMEEGVHREMIDIKDETNNPNYNGSVKLDTVGLGAECTLILEPQVGGPAGGEYVSDNIKSKSSRKGSTLTVTNGSSTSLKPPTVSSRASSPGSGATTRSKTRRDGKPRGMVGLTNLGNTCYMNSALQCIRSCEELSLYFLQERYKEEINTNNVLGHKGVLAKTYAGFISQIYDGSGASSFAPRNLKNTVGRLDGGSVFSGYGQQDSQEFLSFLVDGLHEDLNRIIKKPSVEDPDSTDDTHKDINLIKELGDVYRNNHRSRNNSIVSDLFNGFYKNTMKCPECGKVSIKFDPYSSLTLQLPLETTWQQMVTFVPLGKAPTLVQVDMKKSSSIRDVKRFIAERFPGTDSKRMMMVELYSSKVFKTFQDTQIVSESNIQAADDIVLYELATSPTNFPPPKKPKKKQYSSIWDKSSEEEVTDLDSPYADRLLIPVMHRKAGTSTFSSTTWSTTLQPFYLVITKEESTDLDEIHRKVLAHIAGITTFNMFEEKHVFTAANNDSDTVLTTEEDASSNTEENVKAASLGSESSIVDVSMTGDTTKSDGKAAASPDVSALPEPLRPGAYIPPHIQRMFEIKIIKRQGTTEMLPGNWNNSWSGRTDFPLLASRLPTVPQSRRSSVQSNSTEGSSRSSVEEAADEPAHSFQAGAVSDDDLPPVDSFRQKRQNQYNKRGKRRGKPGKLKQYGKHNSRTSRRTSQEPSGDASDAEESPRLIRLGEGLVLDWEAESFDSLFGKTQTDDPMRGVSLWENRLKFEDPELVAKMSERTRRRKNGIELDACFEESARTEVLSEDNAWYCNRCKEHRTASKTLEIWTAPDILIIHLKRFNSVRNMRDKLDLIVDFPVEGLDISKWVGLPEDKNLVYDLFGVDNHFGGMGGGHYTAYAKNFYDGKWYNYNDSICSSAKPDNLVSSAAYLLFYRRRSETPLGPSYLQELVHNFWNPPASPETTSRDEDGATAELDASAGNGQRAHGSYPNGGSNGSSSASAAVGSRAGVGAGDARKARSNPYEDEDEDVDHVLPGYSGPNEHDEGIAIESLAGPMIGPLQAEQQTWTWPDLTGGRHTNSEDGFENTGHDDDNDSTGVMGGSDIQDERLMEDFGEDMMGGFVVAGGAGRVTPEEKYEVFDQTMPPLLDLGKEDVVESMEFDVDARGKDEDEGDVVEVRVRGNEDVRRD